MTPRLKEIFSKEIQPALKETFGLNLCFHYCNHLARIHCVFPQLLLNFQLFHLVTLQHGVKSFLLKHALLNVHGFVF